MGEKSQRIEQLAAAARQALQAREWRAASGYAKKILKRDRNNAEGLILSGLVAKAAGRVDSAVTHLSRALRQDSSRYDAAVELAHLYAGMLRYGDAFGVLDEFAPKIGDSPRHLHLAATIYSQIGKWDLAWSMIEQADELQPDIPVIMASKAECAVSIGKIGVAKDILTRLLLKNPGHQRNHYQLSRLETAKDDRHVVQMLRVLETNKLPPRGNIFLYYALGKELEDLERWDESFHHYKLAGDAATKAANHDIQHELDIIDTIVDVCSEDWLQSAPEQPQTDGTPIFIVGLPRTGTTLVERIVSSHSKVDSIGETLAFETLLRGSRGRIGEVGVDAIRSSASLDAAAMARDYLSKVNYMRGKKPNFVEKYTYNYLYLGFIAKAFPSAPIIHLQRNPMDACFAMYKQPYFSFALTLDDLGKYYPAYYRLMNHWRSLLGDRLTEVSYEALVENPEEQTRRLVGKLGLDFETACLEFDRNTTPSATASSVQIRSKVHSRSVDRWRCFAEHLAPLRDSLQNAGLDV